MHVIRDPAAFPTLSHPVVTSGTFDGVHLGHRRILDQLTTAARAGGGQSVVLTYWAHPRAVLTRDVSDGRPAADLHLLTTLDERIGLLKDAGVDYLLVQPFTANFAAWTAAEYVERLLVGTLHARHLVIGYDHRFGAGRTGDLAFLEAAAPRAGFSVEEISRRDIDAVGVSSTKIRRALLETGDVATAARYLGRPYALTGPVVRGQQLGRTIGYPTANIGPGLEPLKLVPADGVYAARARTPDGVLHPAMLNIGHRPTVGGTTRTVEAHLLGGFDGDLYDQPLTVTFIARLRDEQKFSGLDALKAQLALDAQAALATLSLK
ncbi:MAG: bifunctional riboflavin kinase/FAD synthetase [Hymenobacteraceae bacterium]|nr:bifunctional riboflavin kinase/FAD synthetase [Hymenobacteraceae bacterium]